MGKIKDFMRSMRARLLTSKSRASDIFTKSRESTFLSSFARTSIDSESRTTIETQRRSYSEVQTTATTPSVCAEPVCSDTMALNRALTDSTLVDNQVIGHTVHLDAHAALEVNVAMLSFARRLPLNELHMIGQGLILSSSSTDNDTTKGVEEPFPQSITIDSPARLINLSLNIVTSDSSWSFACCSARRAERDHAERRREHDECVAHEHVSHMSSEIAEELPANSSTLSLTSEESNLTKSLACCSARQTEQDYTQRKRDDEANPFGGFAGPIDRDKVALWLSQQESINIKVEDHISDPLYRSIIDRPFRPQTMDETSDIQQNSAGVRDGAFPAGHGFIWLTAHMERAPSFIKRSVDSCDLFLEPIGLPVPTDNYRTTSDEDFDNLPNWSDVEDDPEYNVFEKGQFQRSRSATSCSTKSLAKVGNVTTDNAHFPRHSIMTDEELEALPDWSDVEDASEYNEFEKRSFFGSVKNSSFSAKSSKGIKVTVPPAVYIPSEFPGDVADSNEVASRIKPD